MLKLLPCIEVKCDTYILMYKRTQVWLEINFRDQSSKAFTLYEADSGLSHIATQAHQEWPLSEIRSKSWLLPGVVQKPEKGENF